MIQITFVGDGERDAATVPHLVGNILGIPIDAKCVHWARLNSAGSGYPRKLRFAIIQSIDAEAAGLVAVVDRDKAKERSRLRELQAERLTHRDAGRNLPIALGEAAPHGDAWLLDDPFAIREALELDDNAAITSVRKTKDPKTNLNELIKGSRRCKGENIKDVLARVATLVDPARCMHRDETGFAEFVKDVRSEFAHFVAEPDP